jgi:hypothetical protein
MTHVTLVWVISVYARTRVTGISGFAIICVINALKAPPAGGNIRRGCAITRRPRTSKTRSSGHRRQPRRHGYERQEVQRRRTGDAGFACTTLDMALLVPLRNLRRSQLFSRLGSCRVGCHECFTHCS